MAECVIDCHVLRSYSILSATASFLIALPTIWASEVLQSLSWVGTFVSGTKSPKQPQWRRAVLQKSVVSAVSVLKQERLTGVEMFVASCQMSAVKRVAFHVVGPLTAKLRWPIVVLVRGTCSKCSIPDDADRRSTIESRVLCRHRRWTVLPAICILSCHRAVRTVLCSNAVRHVHLTSQHRCRSAQSLRYHQYAAQHLSLSVYAEDVACWSRENYLFLNLAKTKAGLRFSSGRF